MFYMGSYSFLKENLKEIVKNIDKGHKLTFIVHTNKMKLYLKEYLTENLGILVNASFYTLIDISKKFTKIEPLQDFEKEIILKKYIFEEKPHLDGLAEEFSLIIQQLKEYEININDLNNNFVKNIIKKYNTFLEKNGYYDREDLHKKAVESHDVDLGYTFVFGIKSFPQLHKKLFNKIKSLSKQLFVFIPVLKDSGVYQNYSHLEEIEKFWEEILGKKEFEVPEDPNVKTASYVLNLSTSTEVEKNLNLTIEKYKSQQDEVEAVAQKISNLIINGVKTYKIGVVIPNIESYLVDIKEIFKKYKIPYYLIEESRYIDIQKFKKLFYLFKIKEENFTKDSVLRILSNKIYELEDAQDIEEKVLVSKIVEGFEDWKEFILKEDIYPKLGNLLYKINSIPDKAYIDIYIQKFNEIADENIKDEEIKNFIKNTLSVLNETGLYKKLFEEIDYKQFVSIIETFFKNEYTEKRLKGETVYILTAISSEANNFDCIFFLNLNDGIYPSPLKEEILVTNIKYNGVNYPYHILMQEILTFVNLLDKGKKINLSYIKNEKTAPSILIEELKRILEINNSQEIQKPDENQTILDFRVKNAKIIANIEENLKKKKEKLEKIKNIKKEDFKIDNLNNEEIFPVSATDFSTYAYCPYCFYLEKIIKVEEFEESDRKRISPLEKGILIHQLLENLYKNFENLNLEEEIENLKKEFNEKIEKELGYILPSYKPFEEKEAKLLLERLIKFVYWDFDRLKKRQIKPVVFEEYLENEYFKGRIDRADKDNTNNYHVYDYKTSPPKNLKDEIQNKYIQLLVYTVLLEEIKKYKVKEVGIISINDPDGKFIYSMEKKKLILIILTSC